MSNRNRWIMGSAIGLATLAVAIDHTRHRLPEPEPGGSVAEQGSAYFDEDSDSPCSMDDSPCSMDDSPCSMDESPCSMDDSPCSLLLDDSDGDEL